jgi:C4-type Zn-finger protein
MIANLTPAQQQELNTLLEQNEQIKSRILDIQQRLLSATGSERQQLESSLTSARTMLGYQTESVKQLQRQKEAYQYQEKTLLSLASMSKDALHSLKTQTLNANLLSSVAQMTIRLKQAEINLDGEALKRSVARRTTLEGLSTQVMKSAEELGKVHHKELSSDEKREKFLQSIHHLTKKQKKEAISLYDTNVRLEKSLVRHKELHDQMHKVMHHLPEPISDALNFTKGMVANIGKGVLLTGLLAAGLMAGMHAFLEMDEAAAGYKEKTGFTNNMTKEIDYTVHHTGLEYRAMGVTMAKAYEVQNQLANAQSDMFHFAQGTTDALSLMEATMGISATDSAQLQSSFEQIGGLSEASAANTQMMAAKLAEGVGVSPAEMFKDMSKSAGVLSKHMKGNVQLFIQSAAKAKMLGTTLQEAGTHAEKLLDFESGIEAELVAATFVGGQFNLSRARALAYEGDILGAQQATLDALEQSGDFTKQDYHTKKALAAAAGMEVEEIEKQLGIRDKLSKMGGDTLKNAQALIDSGVDISDLDDEQLKKKAEQFATQQRITSQMDEFKNSIAGSVEQIGGRMLPAFQAIMPVLIGMANVFGVIGDTIKFMGENTWAMIAGLTAMSIIAYVIVAAKIKQLMLERQIKVAQAQALGIEVGKATASIFGGGGAMGPVGWALAAAAVLGMIAMVASATKKGDDVFSPGGGSGYGSRTLMGPEGAIQLNNKDSVIAGTDLFSNSKQSQSQPSAIQTASPVASSNNNMINALINEFRGVRADMAGGKIGVYMDNNKVTANVTRTLDTSTRNNFALV